MDDRDDSSLAVAASHGDEAAFKTLFDRYNEQLVRKTAGQLRGDWSGAEDVAQATWLRVHRRLDSYDPTKRPFGVWLHTVRVRMCLNYIRSRRRLPRTFADAGELHNVAESSKTAASRLDSLDKLPPELGDAVRVVYLEDRSFPDAAKILGCSVGTAHRRALLGIQRLREIMGVTVAGNQRRTQVRAPYPHARKEIQMLVA